MAMLDHMIENVQRRLIDRCDGCPIKGTEYCHKVNPMAKKYTRAEKNKLREAIEKRTNCFQGGEVMKRNAEQFKDK